MTGRGAGIDDVARGSLQRLMPLRTRTALLIAEIPRSILEIRDQRVMLDEDLARIYGVATRRLNEQVQRNLARFPSDFMFRLTLPEVANLKSQIATSSSWGGRRKAPYAFTEHGAVMLATVLRSPRATDMSLHIVRAFIAMRQMLGSQRVLARKLNELERRVGSHDRDLAAVVQAIRQLMPAARPGRRRIGF
ncbi:MAG: ORF6N domain-containing protein [bacterium]